MESDFVLGVDLDGVCADYTAEFRQLVASDTGQDEASLTTPSAWGYEAWGIDDDDFLRLHRHGVMDKRMFRSMTMVDGCADTLWRLSDMGIWLRIITHRLYTNWGHAVVVGDTVAWLDEHRIPYRDLCFLGNKPQVEADAYIDDAPHNIEALRQAGNTVICFDQPYNRHLDGLRAHGWDEVEELVTDLATAKGAVQPQLPGLDAGADRLTRRLDVDRNRPQR